MGLQYRAIRAAASALLVAVAIGSGGMAGMSPALAADPATVTLAGTLVTTVDGTVTPLPGIGLVITEELATDGGLAAFQVTTGADGAFAADVFAWGTADLPARVSIATAASEFQVAGGSCTRTWSIAIDPEQDVALAGAAPDPLTVSATTTLLGEVCGTTGTPPGNRPGSGPDLTPPPTDAFVAPSATRPDRLGPALTIGFVVGLFAALLLLPGPGARRRD